ncbi:MAG: S-adenosylmethionine:tRNA ribosyltransferase-isomerase [Marinilabiliales bacterium]|nr:MAG: S-adenosylmethionine:tRNA ribosyltransferase-isomerase [Marinilabiliales bacterium]
MHLSPGDIRMEDYTYDLPAARIAKYPLKDRSASRLLLYDNGAITHLPFRGIAKLAKNGGLMVFNNTRVIQARIIMYKSTGSRIEIFLLEPLEPSLYTEAFLAGPGCRWKCMIGNKKRWKGGHLEKEVIIEGAAAVLKALMVKDHGGWQEIEFRWKPEALGFGAIIDGAGLTPVPPYLGRDSEAGDKNWYQTVYSRHEGSVAAPTAGLHFTGEILDEIRRSGSATGEITLHVGAGTFAPVKSPTAEGHTMHEEHFTASGEIIRRILQNHGAVTAVGTTTVRTLESLYWLGVKCLHNSKTNIEPRCNHGPSEADDISLGQWEYLDLPGDVTVTEAMNALLNKMANEGNDLLKARTELMIVPGYRFRLTDRMMTNFHQPGSTLLLLVAAFIGNDWRRVYEYALNNNFRFLSYGDTALLIPAKKKNPAEMI